MILFGSTFSPFVRKVVFFAAEKGMVMDIVPTRLGDDNPQFRKASPFGKMPALIDGDYHLADSSAIVQYLEARQPDPVLIPTEARKRGTTIWWDEFGDTILMTAGRKLFFNRIVAPLFLQREGNLDEADAAERDELPPLLGYLEGQVPDDGYLVGDDFSLADIAVASPFVNLRHANYHVDETRYPRLSAYLRRILSRPSFASVVDKEIAFLARPR
nr:glutathione S-transferase family protein [uncultured Sphingomonas sp.]